MTNVCRLCSRPCDLVWILDSRFPHRWDMREVISLTTGVEINISDKVTQKICQICYGTVIKMFKFRVAARKNNKELLFKKEPNNKELNNKEQKKIYYEQTSLTKKDIEELESCIYDETNLEGIQSEKSSKFKYTSRHSSINELKKLYPKLEIPKKLLNCNISPKVQLNRDDVDNWFREKRDLDAVSEASEVSEVSEVSELPESQDTIITASKDETVLPSIVVEQTVLEDVDVILTDPIQVSITDVQRIASQEVDIDPDEDSNSSTMSFKNVCKKRKIRKLTDSSEESSKKLRSDASDEEKGDDLSSDDVLFISRTVEDSPKIELSHLKSTNVEICTICNDVIYNAREMKIHSKKHSRCQFCKTRCRTLEAKDKHIESCLYRKAMQSDTVVSLVRVDEDESVKKKYPNVFRNDSEIDSDDDVIVVTTPDDETTRSDNQTSPVGKNDVPDATAVNSLPNSMNLGNISPNFRISKNSMLEKLNFTANEIQTIKTFMHHRARKNNLPIPSNNSIITQGTPEKIFSLKNIAPYLKAYTIPIDLQYNSKLSVSYNTQEKSGEATAKKQIWNPNLYLKAINNPSPILQQTTAKKSITDNIRNFRKNQVQHTTSVSKPHNNMSSILDVVSTSSSQKQLSDMLGDVLANQQQQNIQKTKDDSLQLKQLLNEKTREIFQNKPNPPSYDSIMRSYNNNMATALGNGTKNSNSAVTSVYNNSSNTNCQRTAVSSSFANASYPLTAVSSTTKHSNSPVTTTDMATAVGNGIKNSNSAVTSVYNNSSNANCQRTAVSSGFANASYPLTAVSSSTKHSNSPVTTTVTANPNHQQQIIRNAASNNFQNPNIMSRGINNSKSSSTAIRYSIQNSTAPAVSNNSTKNVNSAVNAVSSIARNANSTTAIIPNNHYRQAIRSDQPRNYENSIKNSNSTVNAVSNTARNYNSTTSVAPNNHYQQAIRNEQPRNFENPAVMGGQPVQRTLPLQYDLTKSPSVEYYAMLPKNQMNPQFTQRPTVNYHQNNNVNNLYVAQGPRPLQQSSTVRYPQYEMNSQFFSRM